MRIAPRHSADTNANSHTDAPSSQVESAGSNLRAGSRLHRFAWLLVLCTLWPASGGQALSISGFKNDLVEFLLKQISVPGEFEIRAGRIEQREGGGTTLEQVQIIDSQGTWFTASRFDFSWSPSRLLRGEVQIDRLHLSGGRLERLPVAKTDAAPPPDTARRQSSGGGWPRSPITLRIGQIRIEDMHIGDRVLPQRLVFDASGALRDEGDQQSLRLDIKRTDAVTGRIVLQYTKRFEPDSLLLSLKAEEAPAGLVAQVLGLPDDVPVLLELKADGPPQSWGGQLDLAARDMLSAQGRFDAAWLERINASFDLDISAGERLPKTLRGAIGERATLRLVARENAAGQVLIETANLSSAGLQASVRGSIDRPGRSLDLALEVASDRQSAQRLAALTRPLRFAQASLQLRVQGAFSEPSISGMAQLDQPEVEGFGAQNTRLDLTAQLRPDRTELDITARALQPFGPAAVYAQALGEALRLHIRMQRSADVIAIEQLTIAARTVGIDLDGTVQTRGRPLPDLRYDIRIDTLTPWAHAAGLRATGKLRGTGRLQPVPDSQRFNAIGKLGLSQLTLNDAMLGQVNLRHSIEAGEQINGDAQLSLQSPQFGSGAAATRFVVRDQTVNIPELSAQLLGLHADGAIRLRPSGHSAGPIEHADLKLSVDSLRPLGQLLGLPLQGTGNGKLRVDTQQGSFDLQLRDLQTADLMIGRLDARGTAQNVSRTPDLNVTIDAAKVRAVTPSSAAKVTQTESNSSTPAGTADPGRSAPLQLASLHATLNGPLSALRVKANANGRHGEHAIDVNTQAIADLASKTRRVHLERLAASYGEERVSLRQPLTVSHGAGITKLEDLALVVGREGSLEGALRLAPTTLDIDLQLVKIPLGIAGRLGLAPISDGQLSGSLRAKSGTRPRDMAANDGRLRLELTGMQLQGAAQQAGRIDANARGDWNGAVLSLQAQVTRPLRTPIVLDARLPLVPHAKQTVHIPAAGQLEATARWQGELAELMALTPPSDHLLGGQGELDIQASGPVFEPNLAGTLTIRKGNYENLLSGTILKALSLDTSFSEAGRARFELTANDGGSGTVHGAGVLSIGAVKTGLDLSLQTEGAVLVRLDEATVQSSIDLKIAGPLDALLLSGRVQIDQAEIRLSNPVPPSIVDLGEVQIKGQQTAPLPNADGGNGGLALDLDVLLPGRAFVRGRGLSSEWAGELKVKGSGAMPLVTGSVRARRGYLDFLGRGFKLQRGLIGFSGSRRIDPSIDVSLEREAGEVTGRIVVTGTATQPKIGFESSPALPEDEVLPVVLFGRSRQSLSAFEAVQLAAGIATLVGGKAGVVDQLRTSLGLDVLRVESSESADEVSAASVGRYVQEGVYVGARQSLDGKRSSVVVEVEVMDGVTVDADVGQGAESSIGIDWRKDF